MIKLLWLNMMIDCIFIPVVLSPDNVISFLLHTTRRSVAQYFKSVIFRTGQAALAGGRIRYNYNWCKKKVFISPHLIQTGSGMALLLLPLSCLHTPHLTNNVWKSPRAQHLQTDIIKDPLDLGIGG